MEHKKLMIGVLVILLMAGVTVVSASVPDDGGARSSIVPELVQVVPVWQQVNSNGFGNPQTGEVAAVEAFSGYLYAGTYNTVDGAQMFRSPDGVTWTAVTQPGFGISHDIAPFAILDLTVFNGRLYASTGRRNASQLWRTPNGVTWAPMDVTGFSDPDNVDLTALAEYGGKIYAGVTNQVTGAQIWSSYTGDNNTWTQVAPDTAGTAPASITSLAEFDGVLYAAVESEAPAQIWESSGGAWTTVVDDGFGDSNTVSTGGMAVFGGSLYVGAGNTADGAQLWRTDGITWTQVITPGFGDPNNQKAETVFVFQNQLYVSVQNTATGLELWRTSDGSKWEQANLDGFGDSNNSGTNWSNATAEFQGHLYVGTVNGVDGGELWSMPEYEANLSIAKADDPDPVTAGGALTYTLTVTNAGPDLATAVTVTDSLPVEVAFGGVSGAGWACAHAAGEVVCTRPTLGTGMAPSIVITVTAPASSGVITNTVTVTSTTADPNLADNTDTEQTTVNAAPVPEADLSIAKADDPDPVTAGGVLTYTLTVTNAGPDPATAVTVTDSLPVEVTYGGVSGAGWACAHAGGEVVCSRPSLGAGVAPSIVITVTAPASGGIIANTATVTSTTVDPNPANNTDTEQTTVNPPGSAQADLAIAKVDDPDPVETGAVLTYTLTITNSGPDPATAVTVTDSLPIAVTYGGASGTGWICGHVAGVVTCTLPGLAVGMAPTIVITATAPGSSGMITNTVTVSAQEADPDKGNNTAQATTRIRHVYSVYLPSVSK